MAWGSYYLFASAAEAQRGMELLLAKVRARRDELVARRTTLFDLLTQARIERNAAIAALEGA